MSCYCDLLACVPAVVEPDCVSDCVRGWGLGFLDEG